MPKPQKKKEMHSQVERRRRERIRSETERLLELLPNAESRDRLSTFQNALARLSSLTEEVGPRDDLLTAEEVVEMVHRDPMFFLVDIDMKCGKILYCHKNVESALGFPACYLEMKSLSEWIRSFSAFRNEYLHREDWRPSQQTTLLFKVNPNMASVHADLVDEDGIHYAAFVTLLLPHGGTQRKEGDGETGVLTLLCRKRQPSAHSATISSKNETTLNNAFSSSLDLTRQHSQVTFRLNPATFAIEDVTETCQEVLHCGPEDLYSKCFVSLVVKQEQGILRAMLNKMTDGEEIVTADNVIIFANPTNEEECFPLHVELRPMKLLDEMVMITATVRK